MLFSQKLNFNTNNYREFNYGLVTYVSDTLKLIKMENKEKVEAKNKGTNEMPTKKSTRDGYACVPPSMLMRSSGKSGFQLHQPDKKNTTSTSSKSIKKKVKTTE